MPFVRMIVEHIFTGGTVISIAIMLIVATSIVMDQEISPTSLDVLLFGLIAGYGLASLSALCLMRAGQFQLRHATIYFCAIILSLVSAGLALTQGSGQTPI